MYKYISLIVLSIIAFSWSTVSKQKSVTNTATKEETRPAYLIASSYMKEGHASLDAYFNAAHPLLEAAGGETIIAGHAGQQRHHFEGSWNEGAAFTVFKFPTMEALLSFWNAPEYQKIKHLRTDVIPPNFTFATEGFLPIDMEHYIEKKKH